MPDRRAYSRLNRIALSYQTSNAADMTLLHWKMSKVRASSGHKPLLILQGAHRRARLEVLMEGRRAHRRLLRHCLHTLRLREVLAIQPIA